LFVLSAAILSLAALSSSASAQQARPLSVEDALKLNYFPESSLQFSPDGERLAYVVRDNQNSNPHYRETQVRTGVPWHATRADIFVAARKTSKSINLTENRADNWSPTWSPDGRFLAFLSDRDGSGQARVWIWEAAKNEVRKVSNVDVRGDEIGWSTDGKILFVTALPSDLSAEEYAKILLSEVIRPSEDDSRNVLGSSVLLYRADATSRNKTSPISDPWNLQIHLRDLVAIEVGTGKTTCVVCGQRIATYVLSPDRSHVAYSRPVRFEKAGSQQILFDIVTVDILNKKEKILRVMSDSIMTDLLSVGRQVARN